MSRIRAYRLMGAVALVAAGLFLVRVASPVDASSSRAAQSASGPQARITQPIDNRQLVTLGGNVHPLARPQSDQGAVTDSTPMNRMLLLLERSPKQEAALEKLLQEQQIKGSPNFHNWLTPEEFGKQFGPADADMQKITQWLASQGFHGIRAGAGRTAIEFSGDVAQVRSAFHTAIHRFQARGKLYQANVSDPAIPEALAPVVAGIVSLNNFPRQPDRRILGAFERTAGGRVVPELTGANGSFFALGPADFATIYKSEPLLSATPAVNGAGVKIGIVGDSNLNCGTPAMKAPCGAGPGTSALDVNDFRSLFGLPPNPPNIVLNGPDPGVIADEGEGDLDTEWSGGVAPGATIDFVVSEDTLTAFGTDLSALFIVDNNSDDILSLSFSECEAALGTAGNAFFNSLWEQAAAQGITVVVATGDGGSAGCDNFNTATKATLGLAVNGMASTPFNTAAGGTDFDDAGMQASFWNSTNDPTTLLSAKGYIPERTWNLSCAATATTGNLTTCASTTSNLLNIVGGSGGPSAVHAKPAWQAQSNLTPADNLRDTPDISLFAGAGSSSKSFYVVCQADAIPAGSPPSCNASGGSFSFLGEGGTSVSTPAFAGVMALIEQENGGRQGNANVILYKIAQGETFSNCNSTNLPLGGGPAGCPFNDVTKGNISVPCAGGSPNCSSNTSVTTGVLVDPAHPTTPAWVTGTAYDLATGLGSINIANLASAWPTALSSFTGTATVLAANGSTTITHGQSLSFTATVTPTSGSGTPTGDVSLLAPAGLPSSAGVGNSLSSGTTTITTKSLPGGTYSVHAHYAGDTTFAPSDSNLIPVIVAKENSGLQVGIVTFSLATGAITSTNATSVEFGSPYILHMDILNSSGNPCQAVSGGVITGCARDATGSITLTDNSAPLDAGTFGVNSVGEAEDQAIQLPPGTHNLAASYSGDASFNASGPVMDTVTVAKATTATVLASNVGSIMFGETVTLTATVNTNSNSTTGPSGTVQFLNNASSLGAAVTCNPSGATSTAAAFCTATMTTNQFSAGAISANYSGDANYSSSASAAQTVSKAATTAALASSATTITSGATVTLTAIIKSNSNSSTGPSGTVQFLSNGSNLGSAATCTPQGATSTAGASCTATLTTTLSAVPPGPVDAPPGQAPPSGLIWLAALSALLCILVALMLPSRRRGYAYVALAFLLLLAGGFAACGGGGTSSSPRTLSITGQYSGDSNYASSTSAPIAITVTSR